MGNNVSGLPSSQMPEGSQVARSPVCRVSLLTPIIDIIVLTPGCAGRVSESILGILTPMVVSALTGRITEDGIPREYENEVAVII